MAFVNEFVSDKDINEYNLDAIVNNYRSEFAKLPVFGFRHIWAIDRESNTFLINLGAIQESGPSGRSEPTGKVKFLLCIGGESFEFDLENLPESSKNTSEQPYQIYWKIIDIRYSALISTNIDDSINILKSALACFGMDGANYQVPNTVVEVRS